MGTAFLMGLFGSLHCLAMCGPLMLVLPGQEDSWASRILSRGLYHSGRIFSYAILGAMVSLLGVAAALFNAQQTISMVTGGMLVIFGLMQLFSSQRREIKTNRFTQWIHSQFSVFIRRGGLSSMFFLGMLNGVLPCGLVYLGLAQAAIAPTLPQGMLMMVLFGLGTLPMMMGISLSGSWFKARLRNNSRYILPILTLGLGIILTFRGLGLGIPFLSPEIQSSAQGTTIHCCKIK